MLFNYFLLIALKCCTNPILFVMLPLLSLSKSEINDEMVIGFVSAAFAAGKLLPLFDCDNIEWKDCNRKLSWQSVMIFMFFLWVAMLLSFILSFPFSITSNRDKRWQSDDVFTNATSDSTSSSSFSSSSSMLSMDYFIMIIFSLYLRCFMRSFVWRRR